MLRPGLDISTCVFPGDDDDQTFHLGAFVDSKLVSVASFYFEPNQKFPGENHFRLRGMATAPDYQGQGLSSSLLKTAFPYIRRNFCETLWCNARTGAKGFYLKTGFEECSDIFDIPGVGPHVLMKKIL